MNLGEKTILKFIKVRMSIMLIMITAIAVMFVGLTAYTLKAQYTSRQSVNIIGRQRMYSQMIAREANRYYILSERLFNETNPVEMKNGANELTAVREQIETAGREFEAILSSSKTGRLMIGDDSIDISYSLDEIRVSLGEIQEDWDILSGNIDNLLNNKDFDNKYENIRQVNELSSKIMNLCNSITEVVVNSTKTRTIAFISIFTTLGLITIFSVIYLLYNINRYLVLPLGELYRGMAEIGLTSIETEVEKPTKKEMEPLINEVDTIFNKMNKLIELIENINYNKSFGDVLEYIYKNFSSFIPYNHIGIAFVEDEGRSLRGAYGISDDDVYRSTQNLYGLKANLKNTSLGRILETGETRIISNLEEHVKGKTMGEYNRILLESGIRSSITLPLSINNKPVGIIFFSSIYEDAYKIEHEKFLKTIANSIAISLEKNIFVDELLYSSILALASLVESRDNETGDHLNRMKKYSRLIASLLYEDSLYSVDISMEYIDEIERFSPLHDIGKVAIRDEILLKPGKLTREEFEVMKTHATYGAKVLKAAESNIVKKGRSIFKLGIEIAESHHEKWDGSGYPYGKQGGDIPLSARIVAVADVFDALTSKRPYKDPFSLEQSFKIIEEGAGKHFDPEIVRVFMRDKERVVGLYNIL